MSSFLFVYCYFYFYKEYIISVKKIFVCSMLIIGTILGAGFCSGKEIVAYYAKFGLNSLFFLPIQFVLYYFIFKIFLNIGSAKKLNSIEQINEHIFKKGKKYSNWLLFLVYVVFASAMFAGIYQIGQLVSDFASYVLLGVTFIFAFFMLLKPLDNLKKINAILIPFLLILIAFTCIYALSHLGMNRLVVLTPTKSFLLFFNPIIYSCQGLALAYYILIKAGEDLTQSQIKICAFISGFILSFLQCLAIIVFCFNPILITKTLPFLSLSRMLGSTFEIFFTIALFLAILTTLLATTRSLFEMLSSKFSNKFLKAFLSLIFGLVISIFGFDKIIEYFYPIIGCIGFYIFVSAIDKSFFKMRFKFIYSKIHNASKNTKYNRASHDKIDIKHLSAVNNKVTKPRF